MAQQTRPFIGVNADYIPAGKLQNQPHLRLAIGYIDAILAAGGMSSADIVSVTTYVVPGQDMAAVMAARSAYLGDHLAASTLVIVAALVRPEWKVEVAVVAAHAR